MTKALDGEELYNQITHKYTEATELINHLLDIGEDIFDVSSGGKDRELTKDEKEFYDLVLEAKKKLYSTKERVLTAKMKRHWNSYGSWSKLIGAKSTVWR